MTTLKSVGRFITYFFLSLLMVRILSFVIYLIIPTPQNTVRDFFTHIKMERYDKAYQLIDGKYKEKRGSVEKFTEEYKLAVQSGTSTKKILISSIKPTNNPLQKIVSVTISVLYLGDVVDTQGSYLVEKIPNKGWRIVENVSSQESKNNPRKANMPILPKSNP